MFLSLKTLYRKRTVIWPFYFYTIIRTLSAEELILEDGPVLDLAAALFICTDDEVYYLSSGSNPKYN